MKKYIAIVVGLILVTAGWVVAYPPMAPQPATSTASETVSGSVELATDAETVTGTATDKVTTPANITAKMAAPGAIGGTTAASLQRLVKQVDKSADAVSLTALECSDTLITNRGWDGTDDQTFTFPDADTVVGAGLKFKFLAVVASGGTADTYFDTEGSTTNVYLDGTAVGDGERVWTQEIAVGESIVFHTATLDGTTYDWFGDTINGVFADKGS